MVLSSFYHIIPEQDKFCAEPFVFQVLLLILLRLAVQGYFMGGESRDNDIIMRESNSNGPRKSKNLGWVQSKICGGTFRGSN